MRYFRIVGEKVIDGEQRLIFTSGQIIADGPVEAWLLFGQIFKNTGVRKPIESVFADGGHLVLKEMKS